MQSDSDYLSLLTSDFSPKRRRALGPSMRAPGPETRRLTLLVLPFWKFFGGLSLFVHSLLSDHPFRHSLAFGYFFDEVK